MRARSVLEVLALLEQAGCRFWVAGVEALVGEETASTATWILRLTPIAKLARSACLATLGFEVETGWRPARVELTAAGSRWVDLHPVRFDAHRNGRQADLDGGYVEYPDGCFATRRIGGRAVPCLSAEQQLRFREGYEPARSTGMTLRCSRR